MKIVRYEVVRGRRLGFLVGEKEGGASQESAPAKMTFASVFHQATILLDSPLNPPKWGSAMAQQAIQPDETQQNRNSIHGV